MASATSKTADEILGREYDWLGCDSEGCVALFSTAGAGYAPPEFLVDTEAHFDALQEVLALPATTEARSFPDIASGLVNTWRLVAERGLYAYDSNPNGGPYHLVAAPVVPTLALPTSVWRVAKQIRCPGSFDQQAAVTEEMLRGRV